MTKKIALIGRPNVGKSSLFNALLGYRRTIVLDMPGTTMDLVEEKVKWADAKLFDSQGIFSEGDTSVLTNLIEKADCILFVVDSIAGCTAFDRWIAKEIQMSKKPALLVINKSDTKASMGEEEFSELGVPNTLCVSAAHRKNMDLLKEWCLQLVQKEEPKEDVPEPIKVAIIGRPNAGKSTLMNRLCAEDVSRVSPEPLTTRDPISHEIPSRDGMIRLIDTAGIRRPRSEKEMVEIFSVQASTRAIRDSDVVLLSIACHEPITDQDMRLLALIKKEGRPTIILLNFWDKLKADQRKKFLDDSEFTRIISQYKMLQISGRTGMNTDLILPMARQLYLKSHKRTKTSKLNKIVEKIVAKNPPPTVGVMNFNILYASQVAIDPPTFVFFMNRRGNLPVSYRSYLERQLKAHLGLKSQTIKVFFREARGR